MRFVAGWRRAAFVNVNHAIVADVDGVAVAGIAGNVLA